MGVLSAILIGFCLIAMFSLNTQFKEQTGVDMPSRGAARGIRRRARKAGISEEEALNRWIERKKRRQR